MFFFFFFRKDSLKLTIALSYLNLCRIDETRQPMSRKVPLPSSRINPYRMVIIARLFILALFLRYRLLNPVHESIGLWLTSVICEIWFAFSWILDQFPKWFPIDRETYLDRLSIRYYLIAKRKNREQSLTNTFLENEFPDLRIPLENYPALACLISYHPLAFDSWPKI